MARCSKQALEAAEGRETLATDVMGVTILGFQIPDACFSVLLFFHANGQFAKWYVNFERPYRRTPIGFDTHDLLLDLVVQPDRTYRWKDEDECEYGRELGLVNNTDHVQIEKAKDQVFAMIEQRRGPFEERWTGRQRDLTWTLPTMPANVTTMPAIV